MGKQKAKTAAPAKERPKTLPANAPTPQADVSVDEVDELLDEIDRVLEENAWVESYRQKGGE